MVVPRVPRLMRPWLRDLLQLRPLPQEGGLGLQAYIHAVVLGVDACALPLDTSAACVLCKA
jgi:hypothetical protein